MPIMLMSRFNRVYSIYPAAARAKGDFDCILLPERDVGVIAKTCSKVFQRKGPERIEIAKIFGSIKLKSTKFSTRVFSMLDPNETGLIDFREFVIILWNFCTIDELSLGYMLFDIYDLDGNGTLEFDEVRLLITEICDGELMNSAQAKMAYNQLDNLNYLAVNAEIFCGICREYRVILQPMRELQVALKKKFFGKQFWDEHVKNRGDMTDINYIPIKELLDMQAEKLGIDRTMGWAELDSSEEMDYIVEAAVKEAYDYNIPLDSYTAGRVEDVPSNFGDTSSDNKSAMTANSSSGTIQSSVSNLTRTYRKRPGAPSATRQVYKTDHLVLPKIPTPLRDRYVTPYLPKSQDVRPKSSLTHDVYHKKRKPQHGGDGSVESGSINSESSRGGSFESGAATSFGNKYRVQPVFVYRNTWR